ncbi:MAG: hypothetical protein B6I26_05980 [Desulfobacteraceae bacterium 4572_130]|nr:MAG: hypothetical protein B6I26_05980 [Desulfobacteraceae bacterium 4572_130]
MKKYFCYLTLLTMTVILFACGGGSSDSKKDDQSFAISGTAAKGIIKNGTVTAYELNTNGSDLAEVGTATTKDDGSYSLSLGTNYGGGVIKIQITNGTDSQMKCDAFDGCGDVQFGEWMNLPNGFSMDAVVKPTEGKNVVQVTPLTHMATARALEANIVDDQAVANANSEVNQMVGVNIITTKIVDITVPDSCKGTLNENGRYYAFFNAGIAGMLNEDGVGTLVEKLDGLANSFKDGQLSNIEIKKILDSLKEATESASASTNNDISEIFKDEIDLNNINIQRIEAEIEKSGDGSYDPEPYKGAGLKKIDQVKLLIQDARTLVEQIITEYETPIEALDVDADAIEQVMNKDVQIMAQLLGETVDQVITYVDNLTPAVTVDNILTNSPYTIPIKDDGDSSMGSVTAVFKSETTGLSLTINGSLTGEQTVEIEEDDPYTGTKTVTITDLTIATNINVADIEISENLLSAITAQNVQITASGKIGNDETFIELKNTVLSVGATESVKFEFNNDKQQFLSSASFKGAIKIKAAEATFSGDAEIVLVALNNKIVGEIPLSIQKLAVNGEFTSSRKTFTCGTTLNITNAASFDTFGYLNSEDEDEDEDNFVKGTITINASVTIPGMPVLLATATASRTNFRGGSASITLTHEGNSYTIVAKSNDLTVENGEIGIVTITNPDGVVIVVNVDSNDNEITGKAFVTDTQVATIASGGVLPIIRYTDGTFESLY